MSLEIWNENMITLLPVGTSLKDARVFDHLTPKLQKLFNEAKQFKVDNNFKFCWTKNLTVFLRKTEESRPIRIKSSEDLARLARN